MTEASKEKTDKYVLKHGNHFATVDGALVEYKEGDIVELTAKQAIQFADKVVSEEEFELTRKLDKAKADAIARAEREHEKAHAQAQAKLRGKVEDAKEEGDEEEVEEAEAAELANAKKGEPVTKTTGATMASNPSMPAKK